ncbi:hypothetical protein Scep_024128 [Stephania cephalantha]|uniref:Uncharacterized protein n=1 Tax=Stephania cephalantha TaxID=152367 RepID=A0AAP0F1F6_9MAGN
MGKGTIGRRLPARHDGGARSGQATAAAVVEAKPRRGRPARTKTADGPPAAAARSSGERPRHRGGRSETTQASVRGSR